MKKSILVSVALFLVSLPAMAETYACGDHTVVTDAESGVALDGRRMHDLRDGSFRLGAYVFNFNEHYEERGGQRVIVTTPTLSNGGGVTSCQ